MAELSITTADLRRFFGRISVGGADECWHWNGRTNDQGYGQFDIHGRCLSSHRLMFWLTKGELPKELDVCHSCDNPPCVNPSHLWLGTHAENMADMSRKGRRHGKRSHWGALSPTAKLTDDKVLQIRELLKCGTSQTKVAAMFGVKRPLISKIALGQRWRHLGTVVGSLSRSHAILSPESAREIRALHAAGTPIKDLAKRFNVDRSAIWRVITGRTWKPVDTDPSIS